MPNPVMFKTLKHDAHVNNMLWHIDPLLGNDSVNTFSREPTRNNRTSIGSNASITEAAQSRSRVSRRQPAGMWVWEQRNWNETSLRNWQQQNNGKKIVPLWKDDCMCDLKLQRDCYKSVARIRLVKTENRSVCAAGPMLCSEMMDVCT
jgi:hypothetical protein